ncbi:MAG: deoxyguanosinetriphosphate triphosphohydrolase [Leeuwenhoekiella sp.]|jgi:dGTPase|nr:deoxyguanosinetriphosphate triphosphohydrolase [Leeuwenhoekiella sp.]HCW63639.1 deoxyguanosinetriphosphate triphosphohydrolase [Leeuwenhoekiella sp.]|tara:strand:- start:11293 stop:12627 length:1335 start_codon:yes stop_codon:yes gene_type:complete
MMNWEHLLSLKRQGDTAKRLRIEQDDTRLGFEVDYDRIIFSAPFRSLQDKTQVIPLSKTDFVHTRLTHSLEVSVVGRSLGRMVGKKLLEKYPHLEQVYGYKFNDFGAIVAAAALAHDIGNPPFGHSGEKAIGEFFKNGYGKRYKDSLTAKEYQDLIKFEGNANGFKVLSQSKPGAQGGLRLSYATLGAFMKYPKESLPHKPSDHIADKKYGFFQSERALFEDVAQELGLLKRSTTDDVSWSRHPLAYLVEAADDICYTIIDFEDGINLGLIPEEYALEYMVKLVGQTIDRNKYNALQETSDRVSYLRALAIGTLINESVDTFMKYEEEILAGTFDQSLIDKSNYQAQITDIINLSIERIYNSREVIEKEIAGYEILSTLLEARCRALDNNDTHYNQLIQQLLAPNDHSEKSLYENLIQICAEVSTMTDGKALRNYKKIKGLDIK